MTSPFDARAFQTRMQRLDALLREAERYADPLAREHTRAIVQAILDLHSTALGRLCSASRRVQHPGTPAAQAPAGAAARVLPGWRSTTPSNGLPPGSCVYPLSSNWSDVGRDFSFHTETPELNAPEANPRMSSIAFGVWKRTALAQVM